jgi:mutator protein MutT
MNISGVFWKMNNFNYCPCCGIKDVLQFDGVKKICCKECSFTFFQNVAASAGVILEYDGKILLTKRAEEPSKGKLDLPGGFVDPNESIENAVKREIKEELEIEIGDLEYFTSFPNIYEYKDMVYNVCDLFFLSKIDALPKEFDRAEIEELILLKASEIPIDEVAFESTKKCFTLYCKVR